MIQQVFYSNLFKEEKIRCGHCQWRGQGADALLGDVYELSEMQEVHCPDCRQYIGFVDISRWWEDHSGSHPAGNNLRT